MGYNKRSWDTFCGMIIMVGLCCCLFGGMGVFLSLEFSIVPYIIFVLGIILIILSIVAIIWYYKDDKKGKRM